MFTYYIDEMVFWHLLGEDFIHRELRPFRFIKNEDGTWETEEIQNVESNVIGIDWGAEVILMRHIWIIGCISNEIAHMLIDFDDFHYVPRDIVNIHSDCPNIYWPLDLPAFMDDRENIIKITKLENLQDIFLERELKPHKDKNIENFHKYNSPKICDKNLKTVKKYTQRKK